MADGRFQTLKSLLARPVGDAETLPALCRVLGIPYLDHPLHPNPPRELWTGLDVGWARRMRLVPLSAGPDAVQVATSRPLIQRPLDQLALLWRRRVEPVGAPEEEVLKALNLVFSESMDTADDVIRELTRSDDGPPIDILEDIPDLIDSADAAPVIRLVNRILFQAVTERASDIHVEPADAEGSVRFRIDGMLYERFHPPRAYLPYVSSRIKVMAELDIAERRLPQDGRFQFTVAEKNVDVRVSVIPTARGERLVLRLLDKSTALLGLEELGLEGRDLFAFGRLITRPHGIILVTGPTGSGKTTTLYAALSRLNTRKVNIITIEDPVEYALPGVGQIHVNPKVGLSFALGLRSVLRHDPDVIMIGEIRDLDTADIAIQSSLTGHLVFSTLHTNDAPGAVTRLVDMGVEPFLVSSAVIGVLAQRLVRVLCPHCRAEVPDPRPFLAGAGIPENAMDGHAVYRAAGCPRCFDTGYIGRTGLYELFVVDENLGRAMARTSEAAVIRRAALEAGMRPLLECGLEKVRRGVTSLEEVSRVAAT